GIRPCSPSALKNRPFGSNPPTALTQPPNWELQIDLGKTGGCRTSLSAGAPQTPSELGPEIAGPDFPCMALDRIRQSRLPSRRDQSSSVRSVCFPAAARQGN